jgi:DNA-directed RNA polymerase specialized sigma24 family protein
LAYAPGLASPREDRDHVAVTTGTSDHTDGISRSARGGQAGESIDMAALLPLVHDQLRRIAQRQMNTERRGHTLQATAFVHEGITHEHAAAKKRGRGRTRVAMSLADLVTDASPEEYLAVDEAICRFREVEPRAGSVARPRLYSGLSIPETAEVLGIPQRTVERDWAYARVWLHDKLT